MHIFINQCNLTNIRSEKSGQTFARHYKSTSFTFHSHTIDTQNNFLINSNQLKVKHVIIHVARQYIFLHMLILNAYILLRSRLQMRLLTLSPPNKLSSAKFLVCFYFQSGSMLSKVGENVVWVSNSLDPGETSGYSPSHPDPFCLHMALQSCLAV